MERILTFIVCIAVTVALLVGGIYTVHKFTAGMEKKIAAAFDGRLQ